jgi:hypothetical protein
MLRKKDIKSNAADGPIIEHPRFGRIQWNQSCSHMPRVAPEPKPALELEPIDIHEMPAEQEIAARLETVEGQEEEVDE